MTKKFVFNDPSEKANKPHGFSVDEADNVVLTMTRDTYNFLLITLGFATGAAYKDYAFEEYNAILRLVNRLNVGNPNYTPYKTKDPEE
jgi:hypothetical protein